MQVYIDTNDTGQWDSATEPSRFTGENGAFSFTNLVDGDYRIRVNRDDQRPNAPINGWLVTVPTEEEYYFEGFVEGDQETCLFGLRPDSALVDDPEASLIGPTGPVDEGSVITISVDLDDPAYYCYSGSAPYEYGPRYSFDLNNDGDFGDPGDAISLIGAYRESRSGRWIHRRRANGAGRDGGRHWPGVD